MLEHRQIVLVTIGILVFVAGTLIGRAQQPSPDFVITVSGGGDARTITVTCDSGCQLSSVPID